MSSLLLEPVCPVSPPAAPAPCPLHVRLLGPFALRAADPAAPAAVILPGKAAQTLVAYLTLRRGDAQPREHLASALWGNRSTAKSRKALRQTLWQVQHALQHVGGAPLLTADEDTVTLHPSPDLTSDLDEVAQATRVLATQGGARLGAADYTLVERAAACSRHEFLAGWTAEWCEWPREQYRALHLELLERLLQHHEASDQPRDVLGTSAAILQVDPTHERAHRAAMAAHRALGNRPAALRQFQRCRQTLRHELHVEPEATTVQLHETLRQPPRDPEVAVPDVALPSDVLLTLAQTLDEVRGVLERCMRLLEASRIGGDPGR